MLKYLLILATLLPFAAFSQDKKDDLMTIVPNDTANLFNQVKTLLNEEKIKIDDSSWEKYIFTKDVYVGKYNTPMRFTFKLGKGKIFLVGSFSYTGGSEDIKRQSGFDVSWKEMDRLANKLGTVTYSRGKKEFTKL
ncbi:MAG: hypothetical protein EOO10_08020 [Chitinophagaceae bacterium]|nr:MAG: hypothetical protein EOO10_08020 [Chitinophagaceae bacterium]